jgi:hypothetical protein
MKELTSFEGVMCANCTTPLEGEYCHHCGQSVHSVLRPVHGLAEEFFETFLHIDGRILHTVPPLFLKPGFLTLEYFSGRRIRYIAPFRLMFVLCLLSFFALHLATDVIASHINQRHQHGLITASAEDFEDDDSASEVQKDLARKLTSLEAARTAAAQAGNQAAITAQIDSSEQQSREYARQRLTELGMPATAASTAAAATTAKATKEHEHKSDDTVTPVQIGWLPASANERLTQLGQHIHDNVRALFEGNPAAREEAKERLITNVFSALPSTMLILIPTFALLLTIFYVFKRRLYMEHLIVALHSHAFIFLSLLLIILAGTLSAWLKPHANWVGWPLGLAEIALIAWVPVYLLLMQKRIYRQGWTMTIVKFTLIGWAYIWLLSLALALAAVLGLAH